MTFVRVNTNTSAGGIIDAFGAGNSGSFAGSLESLCPFGLFEFFLLACHGTKNTRRQGYKSYPVGLTYQGMICTFAHMSHSDLINLWPSIGDFAADLGVEYGTAKAMRRRSSIPPEYWLSMVAASSARGIKGISLDALAQAAAAPERAA